MPIKLTLERKTFCFDLDTISIGRNPECQFAFPDDPRIAPLHAIIRVVSGRWIVESRDGGPFRIGEGRPTQFAWVTNGDVIHLTEAGPKIVFEVLNSQGLGSPPVIDYQSSGKNQTPHLPIIAPAMIDSAFPTPTRIPKSFEKNAEFDRGSYGSQHGNRPRPSLEEFPSNKSKQIFIFTCVVTVVLFSSILTFSILRSQPRSAKDAPAVSENENSAIAADSLTALAVSPQSRGTPLGQARTSVEPEEFIVLVGIGNLKTDDRPHLLSVGWLWDQKTAVVSQFVGKEIEKFEADAKQANISAEACVIHPTPLRIERVIFPNDCPQIAILKIAEPAQLAIPALEQWQHVNNADVEKRRMRGKTVTYISYDQLPRSSSLKEDHGFPLCEYDPETCRQNKGVAHFEYLAQRYYLKSTDTSSRLERGGLLVDEDGKIMGMTLIDSSIVWSETLERALKNN